MKFASLYLKGETMTDQDKRNQLLLEIVNESRTKVRILEWAGRLALENKSWELAERIFASLMERRQKPQDNLGLAQALFQQQRWEEAKECLLDACHHITESCLSLFLTYKLLGQIEFLKQNFEQAEEYFNKAYAIDSSSDSLQFEQAYLCLKLRDYKEAEARFQNLVKNHPQVAKYWLGLALVRRFSNEKELALASLYKALDLEPKNAFSQKLLQKWENKSKRPCLTKDFSFSA